MRQHTEGTVHTWIAISASPTRELSRPGTLTTARMFSSPLSADGFLGFRPKDNARRMAILAAGQGYNRDLLYRK